MYFQQKTFAVTVCLSILSYVFKDVLIVNFCPLFSSPILMYVYNINNINMFSGDLTH